MWVGVGGGGDGVACCGGCVYAKVCTCCVGVSLCSQETGRQGCSFGTLGERIPMTESNVQQQ